MLSFESETLSRSILKIHRQSSTTHRPLIVALILIICGMYFGASLPRKNLENSGSAIYQPLYQLLTDSFQAGKTSLLKAPDPRLLALPNPYQFEAPYRIHDASLYRGKYYVYFGPTPVIILLLPYKIMTGAHLPSCIAVPLFCSLGFLCSVGVFYLLKRWAGWVCPLWLEIAVVVSLGGTQLISFLLLRPLFYEVAISSGYFLVMAGFLFLTSAFVSANPLRFLFFAGASFGLAFGSRPNLLLVLGVTTVFVAWWARTTRRPIVAVSLFIIPVVICGMLFAAYNYARFHNPFNFGIQYQLSGDPLGWKLESSRHILHELNNYFLLPPVLNSTFPYLHPVIMSPYFGFPSAWPEAAVGLLPAAPFSVFALFSFWLVRVCRRRDPGQAAVLSLLPCLVLSGLAEVLFLSLTSRTIGRYLLDFAPLMILAACCTATAMWQDHIAIRAARRVTVRSVILASVIWSVLFNVAMVSPTLPGLKRLFLRL